MNAPQFSDLRKPIALVVDDEPLILMDLSEMVADEGYAVIEASTAGEAYEFLTRHPTLQLLFTDVQMPGTIDGLELAWKVAERWPHICIVVASRATRPEEGELPPTAVFVSKPISAELVHQIIGEHYGSLSEN